LKTKEIVKITISLLLFAVFALFLYYNIPRTVVVQISGTDVKRVDKSSGKVVDQKTAGSKKGTILSTYDLRFINSMAHNGKVMVFRNEDTGYGDGRLILSLTAPILLLKHKRSQPTRKSRGYW